MWIILEFFASLETFGGLALGSILISLVDSFTWLELNLRAFVLVIFVSDWLILASEDPLKGQRVNVGGQWLFSLVSSTNFRRSCLRYATALPMNYSFVVTAVSEFIMLTDLLITTSGKLSCIGGRLQNLLLQNFTMFFDCLRQISKCWRVM